ncbi:MAG TPA: hypothetical protein VJN42_00540 [Candidatus Acidoferrum sp.]|nr:hypothetical protein [Candidatus Acidoferrum sp.]
MVLFFLTLYVPPMLAQAVPPTIHVSVNLVTVAALVTDKQGHDLRGLTADDFTVLEDGRKANDRLLRHRKRAYHL